MAIFLLLSGLGALWFVTVAVQSALRSGSTVFMCPYSWFVPSWIIQYTLLLFPFFAYDAPITLATAGYVVGAHTAFCAGVVLALFSFRQSYRSRARRSRTHPGTDPAYIAQASGSTKVLSLLFLIGILAQLTVSAGTMVGSGLSVAERMNADSFASAREANFGGNVNALGPFVGPFTIMSCFLYVAIPYCAFCWGCGVRWAQKGRPFWLLMMFSAALVSLDYIVLVGGRINVIFIMLGIVVPYSLGKRLSGRHRRTPFSRTKKACIAALILLATIPSAAFQQFRGGRDEPLEQLHIAHWTRVAPAFEEAAKSDPFTAYYFVQLSYLTSSTNMLQYYLELPSEAMPGPYHGSLSFNAVYRNTARFFPSFDPEFFSVMREELWQPLTKSRHLGNVWATLLRDLIADWGFYGSIMALFCVGWFMQTLTDSIHKRPSPAKAVLLTYLRITAIFSCFLNVVYLSGVQWGLLISLTMVLVGRAYTLMGSRSVAAKQALRDRGSLHR